MERLRSFGTCVRLTALGVILAATAPAQQHWVVPDGAALQPVIDAASPGDRIEVQGVGHGDASISKPLDIFGSGNRPTTELLRIEDLGCGDSLRLADLITNTIEVRNCHGTVLFERVLGLVGFRVAAMQVFDSTGVAIRDSRFIGSGYGTPASALRVWRSDVVALDSSFEGALGRSFSSQPIVGDGLLLSASSMLLVRCRVVGGPAWTYYDHGCPCYRTAGPTFAVHGQLGARLTMVGDGFLGVRAPGSTSPLLAAFGLMTLTLEPGIETLGQLAVSVTRITAQPSLRMAGTLALGSSADATVESRPNDLVSLMADSGNLGPMRLPGSTLDSYISTNATLLRWTTCDPVGLATLPIVIPTDPALRGRTLWLQAFVFNAFGQRAASPPALLHLR